MFTSRSLAVLTLGLLLAQGAAPSANAYSFRAEGKRGSSAAMRTFPAKQDRAIAVPIAGERPIYLPDTGIIPSFIPTVDDGDGSFHSRGHWTVIPFAGWQSDFRFASPQRNGQKTAKAEWKFRVPQPGTYDVLATWESFPGLATDATYDIESDDMSTREVVNQSKPPVGDILFGRTWQVLGKVQVEVERGTGVRVQLTNQANSYVVADGMALRRRETTPRGADLTLSVSYDDRTRPGKNVSYTMYLNNMGPNMAEGARVIIPKIAPHIKFDPANSSPGCVVTEDGSFLDCDFGNMEARSETKKTVSFSVRDDIECGYGIYNRFESMSETPDPNTANNNRDTKIIVECIQLPMADLSLGVHYNARTTPGAKLKYSINLSNGGPDAVRNARVILSNPSMLLRFDAEASDERCKEIAVEPIPYDSYEEIEPFSHAILCGFGNMEPQTGLIAPIVFDVDPEAPCGTTLRQLVESDSDTNDPNPHNNSVDTKAFVECDEFEEF